MRILLAHSRYRSSAPSGENLVVDQEADALTRRGHEVVTFQRHSDHIEDWGTARKALLPAQVVRNPAIRREVAAEIVRHGIELVHVHNTFPLLSASVLLGAADAGVPVVATLHNYKLLCASGDFFRDGRICHDCADGAVLPGLRHGCYRGSAAATAPVSVSLLANRSLWREKVAAYVFISAAQADLMSALDLPAERVFVKHNFAAPAAADPLPRRRHAVSYVGRLDEAKGTPGLMAAWDLFRAQRPDSSLRLSIAGHGPLEPQVARWAAADPRVDFHGLLSREEARALVAHGLASLVPSAWEETFGLVAVEAMAAGVAPLAPAAGSFPELIDDRVDGALFAPGAPAGLAEQGPAGQGLAGQGLADLLAEVDRHPERFTAMGLRGVETFRSRFTEDVSLARLESVYEFARANPAGRPVTERGSR